MKIKSVEKKEKNMVEFVVEIDKDEFETAVGEVFKKNRGKIIVPGFRKGKAPRKMVETLYGADFFRGDALEDMLPSVIELVIDESEEKIVGNPTITDVNFEPESEAGTEIKLEAALYPEVTLGEYKGLTAEKPIVDVPDEEVDIEIENMRIRNARIEKANRPAQNGDITIIDFEGFVDGETFEGGAGKDYELTLGSDTFIPGFEEKMLGMTEGEERDLELVFPEEYSEPLAGKDVIFKVKLKELKEKLLPDLDDDFAIDVSEFDTLDELRANIKERKFDELRKNSDASFENALLTQIIESMEAEVPDVMIESQLETSMNNFARQISAYGMDPEMYFRMTGTTIEGFRETMRLQSEERVKVRLALEKIAEFEKIEISDEEIENEYKETAEQLNEDIDKIKERVEKEDLTYDLKLRRAAKIVTESAIAVDPIETDKDESVSE